MEEYGRATRRQEHHTGECYVGRHRHVRRTQREEEGATTKANNARGEGDPVENT